MLLKVQRKDYEDAANKVERANKDYAVAVVRVTAVNNKFQYSVGGAWAIAQALVCGNLEEKLRAVGSSLENLSNNMKAITDEINKLFSARNDVFQKVNASANNVDTSAFQGGCVTTMHCYAQNGVHDIEKKAQDIINTCEGLEDSDAITGSLIGLQGGCTIVDNTLTELLNSFDSYVHLVSDLNAKSALFDADNFITEDMLTQARNDTSTNLSFAHHWKGDLKLVKNYMSLIGEWLEHYDSSKFASGFFEDFIPWYGASGWKTGLKQAAGTWSKKFSERTQGLDPLSAALRNKNIGRDFLKGKSFRDQHMANWDDIRSGAEEIVSRIKGKFNVSKAERVLDKAANLNSWHVVGKGVKAAGRYVGYAGDVVAAIDVAKTSWDVGFSQGDWGQGIGQIAKGATKIGTGMAMGAAIGTAFAGPAGTVVGMVVGGVVGAIVDKGIDDEFSKFGVKIV